MTSLQYQQRKVLELPPNLVASTRQDKMSGSVRTQQQMLILPWVEVRVNLQAKIIVLFNTGGSLESLMFPEVVNVQIT